MDITAKRTSDDHKELGVYMNIFVLSEDPIEAAKMQCDQHVVKMPLETAQMLCTAYPEDIAPYRRTHLNHPCNLWLRESLENYEWLLIHGLALCDEYRFRFEKDHASEQIILWCWANMELLSFDRVLKTDHPVTMDQDYKRSGVVESYRNFYLMNKSRFARWSRNRTAPKWYKKEITTIIPQKSTGDSHAKI